MTAHNPVTTYQQRIAQQLHALSHNYNSRLQQAMHYSLCNGGKHLRAVTVYLVGEACGANIKALDTAAIAIELVHTYSLIHDDLPAMDDDDMRRGQASCHKKFDTATAILAGDALQSLAFEVLSTTNCNLTAEQQIRMSNVLAQAIGSSGMAEGQSQDLLQHPTSIEHTHSLKTAKLIQAAVSMGCIAAQAKPALQQQLEQAGLHFGMAFQWQDDIDDSAQEKKQAQSITKMHTACLTHQQKAILALQQADLDSHKLVQAWQGWLPAVCHNA